MNNGCDAQAPKSISGVSGALSRLDAAISGADSAVRALVSNIGPVLSPESNEKDGPEGTEPVSCELVGVILGATRDIERIARVVSAAIARLEL